MKVLLIVLGSLSLVIVGGLSIGLGVALGPQLAARYLGDQTTSSSAEAPTTAAELAMTNDS